MNMARNLRKGSKVLINTGNREVEGTVIKKYTAPKGSVNVPNSKRTLVKVSAVGQIFSKRPSDLKRKR